MDQGVVSAFPVQQLAWMKEIVRKCQKHLFLCIISIWSGDEAWNARLFTQREVWRTKLLTIVSTNIIGIYNKIFSHKKKLKRKHLYKIIPIPEKSWVKIRLGRLSSSHHHKESFCRKVLQLCQKSCTIYICRSFRLPLVPYSLEVMKKPVGICIEMGQLNRELALGSFLDVITLVTRVQVLLEEFLKNAFAPSWTCLLYTSPSPRD